MQRTSMPAGPRPMVLLVQPSRDDGLEMYTEFLRYRGLAVIPVSDTRNATRLLELLNRYSAKEPKN